MPQQGGRQRLQITKKLWKKDRINSEKYAEEHINPEFLIKSKTIIADIVKIGTFDLSSDLSRQIKPAEKIVSDVSLMSQLSAGIRAKTVLYQGGFYIAHQGIPDPAAPRIGDMKVRFYAARPAMVSVIAQQQGNYLTPYQAKAGDALAILRTGRYLPEQMFAQATRQNTFMTWVLRFMGFGMMFVAFRLMFHELFSFVGEIPGLGILFSQGMNIFFSSLGSYALSNNNRHCMAVLQTIDYVCYLGCCCGCFSFCEEVSHCRAGFEKKLGNDFR